MTDREKGTGATDSRLEHAKDHALGKHDDHPGVADHVGEAAGGVSGVLVGAAAGSAAGPVGTVLGGIVGAMGGWWTGRAISEAATSISEEDDAYYRRHYESSPSRLADRAYDDVRPAYYLGHVASRNPDYRERSFDDIEGTLRTGWTSDRKFGSWNAVRSYASEGFHRGRLGRDRETSRMDEVKERIEQNPVSTPAPGITDIPQRRK